MKLIINRITKVNTQLLIDPELIDYKSLINDFLSEGIDITHELSSKNFNDFLQNNEDQLAHIYYVIESYGHGTLIDDVYADESDFYICKTS